MLFSILIYDEPNSAALRDKYRQAHLDYLVTFDPQTLFAGPFTTDDESADLGSLRLIDFPDRAAAEKHIADEPYVIGGVQKRWQVHRWRASLPYSWRDCPRKEGNIQAIFHGLDHPGGVAKRKELREAHEAYLNEHGNMIMMRGPLLDDAGADSVGSVWLLDVPDLDAGRELLEGDPFYKSGIYKDVAFHRWRFGRVFDRFKI
ncbi:MAG: YciI family protein [Alphaproteobacteria bacterium]|nr:YciI family protein [Alphaproteobacteria bacterium]